jgi:hypothetical protein
MRKREMTEHFILRSWARDSFGTSGLGYSNNNQRESQAGSPIPSPKTQGSVLAHGDGGAKGYPSDTDRARMGGLESFDQVFVLADDPGAGPGRIGRFAVNIIRSRGF